MFKKGERERENNNIGESIGFMPRRSTMESIFLLKLLMEKYREAPKYIHIVFIDLEKAFNRVPIEVMWLVLEKNGVPLKYIILIKDMYDRAVISVRISGGITSEFPIIIGLHQGSELSPYLFCTSDE